MGIMSPMGMKWSAFSITSVLGPITRWCSSAAHAGTRKSCRPCRISVGVVSSDMIFFMGRRSVSLNCRSSVQRPARLPSSPKCGTSSGTTFSSVCANRYLKCSKKNDPDPSVSCMPIDASIVSDATRPGAIDAMWIAGPPPCDHPTTCARSTPSSSSAASVAYAPLRIENEGRSLGDAPKGGKSTPYTTEPRSASLGAKAAKSLPPPDGLPCSSTTGAAPAFTSGGPQRSTDSVCVRDESSPASVASGMVSVSRCAAAGTSGGPGAGRTSITTFEASSNAA